nr:hypothetical protein [Micromonospora sp. DSM 115978]
MGSVTPIHVVAAGVACMLAAVGLAAALIWLLLLRPKRPRP